MPPGGSGQGSLIQAASSDTPHGFRPAMAVVEAKLHAPTARPGTIDRPRLVRLLTAEPSPRVISLIAPPGYGKTTLLAQWIERERRDVAWLTLDGIDNDPAVLLSYLAVAFDRIEPVDVSIRPALIAPRERILATAVPRLLSEMHRSRRPTVLVLDDVHRLTERTSLDALSALLDHVPPGWRVALAGRAEPDLPLARLRAQGELLEIGPALLALDEQETEALTATAGYRLAPDAVRELTARTEGWPAGVYLATLAGDAQGLGTGPLIGVSGRDRYIAAYLRSEFERNLDDDDMALLTRTAILDTITPPLAEAVSGMAAVRERLRSLAKGNLLIQELEVPTASYRYHNLLRDYLSAELERREPGAAAELHQRAATWYFASGNVDRAVEHAIAAGAVDAAARMVTAAALQAFYGGNGATLERWLGGFDPSIFERHPPLAVIAGWIHLMNGRADATDRMADIAERATFEGPPGDGSVSFESQRAMLRAMLARRGPRDMLANAELAVSQEPSESEWRPIALWLLGSAHLLLGQVDAADARFAESAADPSTGTTAAIALAMRAGISIARRDWRAAEEQSYRSRAALDKDYFNEILPALIVYAVGARVAIHRGDLTHAHDDLVRAQVVRPLATYVAPWFAVNAYLELARAYLALSDRPAVQVLLREAEQIVRRRPDLGVIVTDLLELRRRLATAAASLAGSSALTAAELRVLWFLPTYLSYAEIGDRMMISRNTVKTHAMSIYGKLQASSRGEAVESAVELGLLDPIVVMPSQRLTP